ncbi:hypothetical protein GW17_00054000, partial [Ensete ventricosum]
APCGRAADSPLRVGHWRSRLAGAQRAAPCGLATGGRHLWVRHGQPLAGWPLAAVPCGRAAGSRPRLRVAAPCGLLPLQAGGVLAVADRHLAWGLGRSRLPLAASHDQPLLLTVLAANAEIVYPYISDPNGEDEGGQASSSLAVSTRWISAVKLLQYDLTTLAQREGGE